ncbi:MAG: aldo/keto reductase [Chloroflexota bacterium]
MNYRHLGRTGIRVSELSFGSWITFKNQVNVDAAVELMAAAYDAGVNFFDNAESYANGKSEEVMGAALRRLKWRRGSYLVTTKLYWGLHNNVNEKNTLNRKRLIEGINGSLARLQLDYVDVIYCHRPDKTTPIEETVWAMHNIIEQGKAMYWGTSEWSADEIVAALFIAEKHHLHKPITEQTEYNLFEREKIEKGYSRLFHEYGYGTTTFSPLAMGMLTGKYLKGVPKESRGGINSYFRKTLTDRAMLTKVRGLQPIAKSLGCTLSQLAIAWCLRNPNVSTVILGASKVEQLHENLGADKFVRKLTPNVLEKIDKVFGVEKDDDD